jgi:HD-GYP domain-containing protein (c-di-GMP phosphodiesterase class II)
MFSPVSAQRLEHSIRLQKMVAGLACAMAQEMALTEWEIETVHIGARLHDIGELGLPAPLFMKPSRLTMPEYGRVRQHCRIGYDMIRDVDCPWPVGIVVLQHHERMDGSGYPDGLEGYNIAVAARVVAVADVVSAICTDQPYRKARSVEFALDELRRGRGSLYDGDAVDACIRLFTKGGYAWPPREPSPSPVFSAWVEDLRDS